MLAPELSPASVNADEKLVWTIRCPRPKYTRRLVPAVVPARVNERLVRIMQPTRTQGLGAWHTMLGSPSHDLRPGGSARNGLDCKYLELWAPAREILVFRGG